MVEMKGVPPLEIVLGEEQSCRICMGDASEGKLFSPCLCKGTMRFVHVHCLQRWRQEKERAPSYYRCDQCHYQYNMKRVDAAGFFKHPCVVELFTCFILLGLCVAAGFFVHFTAPNAEIVKGEPVLNAALLGMLMVGILSFIASLTLPSCSRSRTVGFGCDPAHCRCPHCPLGMPCEVRVPEHQITRYSFLC